MPTSEDDEEVRGHFLLSSKSFSAGRCLGDAGRAMSAVPASAAEDESVCTLSNDGAEAADDEGRDLGEGG